MRADWPNQTISRHKDRNSKYLVASDFLSKIEPSNTRLDLALKNGDVLKDDRTTTVARHQSLIIKRYNPRDHFHKYKRAFRRSRARRCWVMSYAFNRAGLNVAQPVMMYECRRGPIRTDAYFVNTDLQGKELLTLLPTMDSQQQQRVASAIRDAFAKMRQHRLSHGDMKASNLLWVNSELFFIDLDAATQHKSGASWLMRHRKDVKRFLKNWHDQPKLIELFDFLNA